MDKANKLKPKERKNYNRQIKPYLSLFNLWYKNDIYNLVHNTVLSKPIIKLANIFNDYYHEFKKYRREALAKKGSQARRPEPLKQ